MIKKSIHQAIVVSGRIFVQLIITKAIAIYIAPNYFAYINQFQNICQIFFNFLNGCINNALIAVKSNKKSSERKKIFDEKKLITLTSVITGLMWIVALFLSLLNVSILGYKSIYFVFLAIGMLVQLMFIKQITNYSIDGKSIENIKYQIPVMVVTTIINYLLIAYYKQAGALISIALSFSLGLIILRPRVIIYFRYLSINNIIKLSTGAYETIKPFFLMYIIGTIAGPVCNLILRQQIILSAGIYEASMWDAATKLSSYYIAFSTAIFGFTVVPNYAKTHDKKGLNKMALYFMLRIIIYAGISTFILFISNSFVIRMILSAGFCKASPIYKLYIIGDFIRLASWVISVIFVAKGESKLFILVETFAFLSITVLSVSLPGSGGIRIGYAYIVTNIAYFFVALYCMKYIKFNSSVA